MRGLASCSVALIVLAGVAMDASAQSRDSTRLALARRLLDVMQHDTQLERLTRPPTGAMGRVGDEAVRLHREFQLKYLTPDKVRPPVERALAELYTEGELKELIAFHDSPLGRKYIAMQPKIAEAAQGVIGEVYRTHAAEFQEILLKAARPPGSF